MNGSILLYYFGYSLEPITVATGVEWFSTWVYAHVLASYQHFQITDYGT